MRDAGDMNAIVRQALASDAIAVTRIYVDSWNRGLGDLMGRQSFTAKHVARWEHDLATSPTHWWVSERQDEVVGFVGIGDSRDPVRCGLGELDTIAVEPCHWRQGTGRHLMNHAVKEMAKAYREAIVWTVAGYDRGLEFYAATGWTRDGGHRDDGRQISLRRRLHS